MSYVPAITEEEFNMAKKAMLNGYSKEWARILNDLDFGSCQIHPTSPEYIKDAFDNAVDLGLMTKTELGHGIEAIYKAIPHLANIG